VYIEWMKREEKLDFLLNWLYCFYMNKYIELDIPHFSQLQEEDSSISEWERKICWLTCIKMCIEYFKWSSPNIDELLWYKDDIFKCLSMIDGEEKSYTYYIPWTWWLHYALIAIAKKYWLHWVFERWITKENYIEQFYEHLEANKWLLASVSLDFENKSQNGWHLVIIKGIKQKVNWIVLVINDPIKKEDIELDSFDFENSFSGSAVLISDRNEEKFQANYPIYINTEKYEWDNTCYLHIHEDEELAYSETKDFIEINWWVVLSIHQNRERFLRFQIEDESWEKIYLRLDPNRIFDDEKLKKTLIERNFHLRKELLSQAFEKGLLIRNYILGKLNSINWDKIVWIHTNKYLNVFDFIWRTRHIFINPKMPKNAFIIVSNLADYENIKTKNISVVFFEEWENDGSIWDYLQREGKRYFTIETWENDWKNFKNLLELINKI